MNSHDTMERFAKAAEQVADEQRAIQADIDAKERRRGKPESKKGAMQAGARRYPELPLPHQHQQKPGSEAELELQPMFEAPHYKGSEKLQGKVALITGGGTGIGAA